MHVSITHCVKVSFTMLELRITYFIKTPTLYHPACQLIGIKRWSHLKIPRPVGIRHWTYYLSIVRLHDRHTPRIHMLWKATRLTLNDEKWKHMLDLEIDQDKEKTFRKRKKFRALGKTTVCAEPKRWVRKCEPFVEH